MHGENPRAGDAPRLTSEAKPGLPGGEEAAEKGADHAAPGSFGRRSSVDASWKPLSPVS